MSLNNIVAMARDDFSAGIKDALAKRVNLCCSNPSCGQPTSGPHSDLGRALNIGVAAHITAAASGGPRFDESLTSVERGSAENGIWLCQNCAKLVDNDAATFPVNLLRKWKLQAEAKALFGVRGLAGSGLPQPNTAKHTPIPRIYGLGYEDARNLLIDFGWQPKMRHWSDGEDSSLQSGNGPYYWDKGFHEIVSSCPTGFAPCTFAFQDVYGNLLVISTIGEAVPESDAEAVVARWHLNDDEMPHLSEQTAEQSKSALISVARRLTPPNILEAIPLGTPREKVRERLGVPDIVVGNRSKYRFEDTQVEISFDAAEGVSTLVVALVCNRNFRGVGSPIGDYVLGRLTINELMLLGHLNLTYRS